MAMEKQQRLRVLVFPWLAHGHITPFLQLSKKLSSTNYFTVYLCSTSVNLNSIKQNLYGSDASVNLVELAVPSSPELPPHLHTTRTLPSHLLPSLIKAFQESSSSFSDICDSLKPHLLIYDVFQPWAPHIASSKGIPAVLFSTTSAASLSFFHHVMTGGTVASFPFPAIHLPQHELDRMTNRIGPNIKRVGNDSSFGIVDRSTDIILVKSCKAVEEKYIGYLSVSCKKEVVSTGPLISVTKNGEEDDDVESSEIMTWLNGKNHGSTVYISFGSECFLSKEQIAEIAKGLELCDVNFLWVIRFPAGEADIKIEDELSERAKKRGLVVRGWAPQTKILGHPSIGGFVSHCGWSSVMESIYYGVPVIAMPMKSEQPLNAQLAVEAGVGVEVVRDGDCSGIYVGEEVAKAVKKVMVEKAVYEGLRKRARRLSEAIREKEDEEVGLVADQLSRICIKSKKEE